MWIERTIKEKIFKSCKSRPAVLLTGARQTGKSSLLKKLFPDYEYVTLDKISAAAEAEENPEHFLQKFDSSTIIDEIQYVPSLFRVLKIKIDDNRGDYGKWIITGSQKFALMKNVSESLAGRIGIHLLETLSTEELRKSNYFIGKELCDAVWKGGYPEVWANKHIYPEDFFEDYIQTYIEKDLKELINISSLRDFRRFLRIVSLRIGQLVNYTQIANDVGVSNNTIKNWISALETSGIIFLLPPFFANIGKRMVKAPKLYFADSGLASYLLGINSYKDWYNHIYKGQLWENFVFNEIIKQNGLIPGRNVFFYRDQNAVEIDFVIERKNKLFLVEAKASEYTNEKKLNFKKVTNALKGYDTEKVLCSLINEKNPIALKDFNVINPLMHDIAF